MSIGTTLNKEVGAGPLKLPLWGWAIAGVGGVLLARKVNAGFGSASSADTSTSDTTDPTLGGFVGPGGALNVPSGAADPVGATITDNNAWRIAAVQALINAGYDAILASSAIEHYLDGVQLTTQEAGAVQYAITRLGPPPEATPPPIVQPPPTQPPPSQGGGSKPPALQQSTPYYPHPALPSNHLAGEAFVDFANSKNRGTWWLTNWGGVYAVGGAPYKGNMITYRVAPKLGSAPSGQTAVSIAPYGDGYVIADNWPNTGSYAFP